MNRFLVNLRYAFNPRKPLLMLRLIWIYATHRIFRIPYLRYVDYSIGFRCNLKCPHCFNSESQKHTHMLRMSPKKYADVVKQCMSLGACNFSFQGGEPLVYEDLFDYIKAAQPHKNVISVSTNGTLVTYKMAKKLKKAGVDILTVSVDKFHGNREKLSNVAWYHNAKKAGLKITISTVLEKGEVDGVLYYSLLRFVQSHKIIWNAIFLAPIGHFEGQEHRMLSDLEVAFLRGGESRNPYIRTDFMANYSRYGCGAAKEILFINSDGSVQCCPFIPLSFGNVRDKSIKRIRREMLKIPVLKKYHNKCIAGEDGGFFKHITQGAEK